MEFTFHNSYGILELVPSTVMFLIKLNCWLKSHSNTATLLLGESHCYKNCTVVITIWLTVTKYHISQMTMDLLLFTNMFFHLSQKSLLPDYCIHEWHDEHPMRSRNWLPLAIICAHPWFLVGYVLPISLVFFLLSPIMGLYVLNFVLECQLRFPHKNYVRFVYASSCLLEGSCLIYVICVCLCIVVSNTYCVVLCGLFVFELCTLCYQFL